MKKESDNLYIEIQNYKDSGFNKDYDLDKIIYDINSDIDLLSSQADKLDYLVAIGSGLLCGLLDIIWVGDFSLERGRKIASDEIDNFVIRTSKLLGCKSDDLESAVKFWKGNSQYLVMETQLILEEAYNTIFVILLTTQPL